MQVLIIESAEKFAEQLRQKLLAWTLDDGDNRDRDEVFMNSIYPIEVPSDAVELVEKIREGSVFGHDLSERYYKLLDTEAAALITAYSLKVSRRMLYEISNLNDDFPQNIDPKIDAIAAKFGYHAE